MCPSESEMWTGAMGRILQRTMSGDGELTTLNLVAVVVSFSFARKIPRKALGYKTGGQVYGVSRMRSDSKRNYP